MNRDAILLAITSKEFEKVVNEAFSLYGLFRRDGNILHLCESEFIHSSLVQDTLLTGESQSLDTWTRGLQALLYWVVDKLKPLSDEHSFISVEWRLYNVLFYPYLADEKLTFEELSAAMGISVQRVYDVRLEAIAIASKLLQTTLRQSQEVESRKSALVTLRYRGYQADEQRLLRLAAVLRHPIPLDALQQLAQAANISEPAKRIHTLCLGGLLIQNIPETTLSIHPEARNYLFTITPAGERIVWHTLVADYYQSIRNFIESAFHWREANADEKAAILLSENYKALVESGQIQDLYELIAEFHQQELGDVAWARLKITAGQAAEMVEDIETAIEEYGRALGTRDIYYKALAYYRRAEAFKFKNVDQSLNHYSYGIRFLQTVAEEDPALRALLLDMYIDNAWIYLQELQDTAQAAERLTRAQELVPQEDSWRRARICNALARLSKQQGDLEGNIAYMLEASLAADETQDRHLMMKMYLNLGMAYAWAEKHRRGLENLEKASRLAQQIGDEHFEAKCYKTMAAQCFFQEEYWDSVHYNEKAYAIFKRTNNLNWLGHICHDLAEAHCKLDEIALVKQYFAEAKDIANKVGDKELLEYLKHLADECPQLAPLDHALTPEQLLTYEYVKEHGSIQKKDCKRLLDSMSDRTVLRNVLGPLVDMKILVRVGDGRATRYVLKKDVESR